MLQETWGEARFLEETGTKRVSAFGTAVKCVSDCTTTFPEMETWVVRPETRFTAVQPTFPKILVFFFNLFLGYLVGSRSLFKLIKEKFVPFSHHTIQQVVSLGDWQLFQAFS